HGLPSIHPQYCATVIRLIEAPPPVKTAKLPLARPPNRSENAYPMYDSLPAGIVISFETLAGWNEDAKAPMPPSSASTPTIAKATVLSDMDSPTAYAHRIQTS